MDDHGREPGARADRRLATGPRDHRDAAARARRPGAPPAAPERLGQGDRGGSRRARRELRRQLACRAVPVRPGVRGDRVAGLDAARHRDRRLRAAVDLRPARGHRRLPRGTADGAVPAHRPGHRGAAAPRGRRGDRRATRRLARLARPADRRRGAAVPVRRRSWRTAVGRPVRTGRHASCRAASRLRRVTGGVARATPASRTLAARLARPRDRAARGRHRGDPAEPRRARHPPRALPGHRAADPRGHDAGRGVRRSREVARPARDPGRPVPPRGERRHRAARGRVGATCTSAR